MENFIKSLKNTELKIKNNNLFRSHIKDMNKLILNIDNNIIQYDLDFAHSPIYDEVSININKEYVTI